jgi:hypothetical protein
MIGGAEGYFRFPCSALLVIKAIPPIVALNAGRSTLVGVLTK